MVTVLKSHLLMNNLGYIAKLRLKFRFLSPGTFLQRSLLHNDIITNLSAK